MAKYIDAEYVINGIRRRAEQVSLNETAKFAIDSTIKLLEEIPAADVEEVTHGEWVDVWKIPHVEIYATCSACKDRRKHLFKYDENNIQQVDADYCPNCGAKMDGGKAE